ncbi:MAG: hypothetical protein V4717_14425 [Bacteroidota bacterium]
MDDKTLAFNEGQLKKVGFAEAFTPELVYQMQQGVPIIQHNFKKEYEGDKVSATLHLKKSSTSDHYFLNKFDLQLKKEGHASSEKQTFYITKKPSTGDDQTNDQKVSTENKYTLKEAYNLLSGRPVHKTLVSNEGQEYQAWVKMNFKNVLDNGNKELKQYTKNYGFDLNEVLNKYPIKELTNELYKQSLIDSLHRGNLQKATFVGPDGKEEKLFVSPSITTGSLNVYDENKQRIPTDKLLEKQYIGNDLASRLNQFVLNQDTQKQQTTNDQKISLTTKQNNDAPGKKQSKKQKVP